MNIKQSPPFWNEDIQICLHGSEDSNAYFGSVNPPVILSSLFTYPTFSKLVEAMQDLSCNPVYSRGTNPTVQFLELKLAALERGELCKCFGSGMGAISACLFSLLQSGDHIVFVNNIYGPVINLLQYMKKNNISFSYITEEYSIEIVKAHIQDNTKMIYFESPATMSFNMIHIKELCDYARSKNIITLCDNTYATPLFQKPILLGCDIVAHSLTKYIGGHSDIIAGAIITTKQLFTKIFYEAYLPLGSVLSPLQASLCIRSLRTLPFRLKRHEESAIKIVTTLKEHSKINNIGHPIFMKQFHELGELYSSTGLFSINIDTNNIIVINQFLDNLQFFQKGVSWGGFESLAISPHNNDFIPNNIHKLPLGIIRLSVGLEDVNMLIDDISKSLDMI